MINKNAGHFGHRFLFHALCFVSAFNYIKPIFSSKVPIYIGGFFPMQDGGWDGSGILPASLMAIEDINADPRILSQYELRMVWNNSKCDIGESVNALYHQLSSSKQLLMLIGAGCSSVTKVLAQTAMHWNLVQVSHSSSSPDLDNRDLYPYLFRAYPSESVTNPPKIALFKQLEWKRVAMLQTNDGSFDMLMSDLNSQLLDAGIDIVVSEKFGSDARGALQNIYNKDARVIIAAFFPAVATQVFCLAYNMQMTGSTFTWILPGWFEHNWWATNDTSCKMSELEKAVQLHIVAEVISLADPDTLTDVVRVYKNRQIIMKVEIKSPRQFTDEYSNRTSGANLGGTSYASSGYDSVWIIAHALNKTNEILMSRGSDLTSFSYTDEVIRKDIFRFVNETLIEGVSGRIQFNHQGMRIGTTRIKQYKDNKYINIMEYDIQSNTLASAGNSFEWKTGDGEPPSDGPILTEELQHINTPLFYFVNVITSLGILFNVFLLVVNIVYRHRRILKMTSPNINYLICSSSLLIYVSTYLIGIDSNKTLTELKKQRTSSNICIATSWLLTLGFTTSFGAIIAKAFRISRLISTKVKKHKIKDWNIFVAVSILAGIDLVILTTWTAMDPLMDKLIALDREKIGEDTFVTPYIATCTSKSDAWLISIYAYKGILLTYGAIVAWEQRNIKMTLLNEAKSIALTIYTVMVLCIIGVPVSFVLETKLDFVYAVCSFCIVFGTTIMLGVCYLPKVQIVLTNSVAAEDVMISSMTSTDTSDNGVDVNFALKCTIAQLEKKVAAQEEELKKVKDMKSKYDESTSHA